MQRRSLFVSVIAWLGIGSGCMATLGGVMMVLANGNLTAFGLLAGGIMGLIASVGLLRRRNWARLSFIGVQAYAILNGFANVVSQPAVVATRLSSSGLSADDASAALASARSAMLVAAVVFTLINGLVIAKLCSRRVRAEFEAAEGPA